MSVKVGVVGCGWFGSAHARVLRSVEGAELRAVMDVSEEAAKELASRYNVRHYTSLEDMVRAEDLDAVTIAVTPQYLFPVTQRALELGVSVMTEKPVVVDEGQLERLSDLVRESSGIFMPGFIEIFNPAVKAAGELLSKGKIGEVLAIWSRRVGRIPKKTIGWSIGVSLDLAIHEMYVQRYLLGSRPEKVYSFTKRLISEGGEDMAIFLLEYRGGVVSTIEANWLTPSSIREMLVMGSDGSLVVQYPDQLVRVETTGGTEIPRIRRAEPLFLELSYFIDHVKKGKEPEVGIEMVRDVLSALFMGLKAEVGG